MLLHDIATYINFFICLLIVDQFKTKLFDNFNLSYNKANITDGDGYDVLMLQPHLFAKDAFKGILYGKTNEQEKYWDYYQTLKKSPELHKYDIGDWVFVQEDKSSPIHVGIINKVTADNIDVTNNGENESYAKEKVSPFDGSIRM